MRSDLEVIGALASRLGHEDRFRFDSPRAVFDELRRVSAGSRADYSGITYERLDTEPGVFWPCPDVADPGSLRLFAERFAHPDGRARFVAVEYRPSFETPDDGYPITLTTGRNREHYNSGNQTRRLARLNDARPQPLLEVHPTLASRLGISDGSPVVVESRRGSAIFQVTLDDGIRPDTVFAPFHWGGAGSANLLTAAAVDPICRMPEFKVSAVRIRPADGGSISVVLDPARLNAGLTG